MKFVIYLFASICWFFFVFGCFDRLLYPFLLQTFIVIWSLGKLCHTIIAKRVYQGDDNFAKIYLILHSLLFLHRVMLYSKGIGDEG